VLIGIPARMDLLAFWHHLIIMDCLWFQCSAAVPEIVPVVGHFPATPLCMPRSNHCYLIACNYPE